MMENFYNALVDTLRADATLVSLTGYTPTNLTILRGPVPKNALYPNLVFVDLQTTPAIPDTATIQKYTVIMLQAQAKDFTTVVRIADRLDVLTMKETQPQNVQYYDITSTTVQNNWTHWRNRGNPVLDEDTDVWEVTTVVDFSWHLTSP